MFAKKKVHRHVGEIPLAPIIDMLVCVIFFLILSTTFTEYNKVSLPPASSSIYSGPTAENPKPPLSPHLYVKLEDNKQEEKQFSFVLKWSGESPDQIARKNIDEQNLNENLKQVLSDFKARFPKEKSIQLALGFNVSYQKLVSVMDQILPIIPDVVLESYADILQAGL